MGEKRERPSVEISAHAKHLHVVSWTSSGQLLCGGKGAGVEKKLGHLTSDDDDDNVD